MNKTTKIEEKLEFKLLQLSSNYYLISALPDNWYKLTEEEQNEFLLENVWQPLENYSPDFIWENIENAAILTKDFINKNFG